MAVVLPVMTLMAYYIGYLVRMVRASMVEVMTQPYIRTAVLKGMSFRQVITKHAMRNALLPLASVLPTDCVTMIGRAAITEPTLSW